MKTQRAAEDPNAKYTADLKVWCDLSGEFYVAEILVNGSVVSRSDPLLTQEDVVHWAMQELERLKEPERRLTDESREGKPRH